MRCFKHQDKEAVGSCRACSKGLCSDCASDLGYGLACKGKHENLVETYNALIEKNAEVYDAVPKNLWITPIFFAFMGLVFAVDGFIARGITDFSFIIGIGFIVFAIIIYIKNKQLFSKTKPIKGKD
jgi:hypothetical protein